MGKAAEKKARKENNKSREINRMRAKAAAGYNVKTKLLPWALVVVRLERRSELTIQMHNKKPLQCVVMGQNYINMVICECVERLENVNEFVLTCFFSDN
jgi:hypothetical protein